MDEIGRYLRKYCPNAEPSSCQKTASSQDPSVYFCIFHMSPVVTLEYSQHFKSKFIKTGKFTKKCCQKNKNLDQKCRQ